MERLEITDLAGKSFRKLSGGQSQRVLLARALCAADKVLLLDEPAAGLDPVATGRLYRIIKELNRDGMAIIMVSHDLDEAARYAAHILHLGKHSFYGTAKEYFGSKTGAEFAAGQRINDINRQVILDQTKPGKPVMPIRPKKQKKQSGTEGKDERNS